MTDPLAQANVRRSTSMLTFHPLSGLPHFAAGMSIAEELEKAAACDGLTIEDGDVLVLAQKIVSKVEGRTARLGDVVPSNAAAELAGRTARLATLTQLILDESETIVRASPAVIIARHRTGHTLANAGIDTSNVGGSAEDTVLLWPKDPDQSARRIRADLRARSGAAPAVIIADSLGRAWRVGTVGVAIGVSGLLPLSDRRGEVDLFGRVLQATVVGVADSLAAAAVLVMGEGAEGIPAVLIRGAEALVIDEDGPGAAGGLRPLAEDLFQ